MTATRLPSSTLFSVSPLCLSTCGYYAWIFKLIQGMYVFRYTEARALNRKIIFHAGPTNSGKTYHAMERFMNAESGIYCGPLKLLASEVFNKSNSMVSVLLTILCHFYI